MKARLLLFLAPYNNSQKNTIAATLAWLAKECGVYFDLYYEAYHSGKHFGGPSPCIEDYFGSAVIGGGHQQRFYFLNNTFEIDYAIFGETKILSSFLDQTESKVIVETKNLTDFYREVFSHYHVRAPRDAVIIETSPLRGEPIIQKNVLLYPKDFLKKIPLKLYEKTFFEDEVRIPNVIDPSPYCYPEIYYRRALGLGATPDNREPLGLCTSLDCKRVHSLFVNDRNLDDFRQQGLAVQVIDKFQSNESYWSLTSRIARRWLKHSQGVAYCDPVLASYWLPWFCRHNRLAVYEVFMSDIRGELKDLIEVTGDKILYGRQSCDQDITELSRSGITFQIIDPGGPIFPITEELKYQMFAPEKSYYEFEPSTDTLKSLAFEGKILCTILFYCPDIRHSQGLPHILELVALTKIRIGLGITVQWYKFVPEILEMINVPLENGGAFPNVEPILCSTGFGVAVEAGGFLSRETLQKNLEEARRIISEVTGSKYLPKGHYPFLDTIEDYPYSESALSFNKGSNSLYDLIAESGFEYCISYASPGSPKVLYRRENFVAINHTCKHWFPHSPFIVLKNLREIRKMETLLRLRGKPGWIVAALDSPLWLFPHHHWEKGEQLLKMASYIKKGGMTGKLVNTTPHTIARYAKILEDKNLL